ncbi:MAG: hypothetical protein MK212_16255 [Saprospiraceae bacterium]|uniref:hypothetical protein n=1 Tax=Kordia sp. TaxID=1965332 RepID=UPI0025BC60D6|nr:hypothetical protein [Kordia sp.]MCH2045670.1 hypothetical protein [Saprospiraceae bacterium]MCH2197081.1 hypothetical protein [Kordia sp.]
MSNRKFINSNDNCFNSMVDASLNLSIVPTQINLKLKEINGMIEQQAAEAMEKVFYEIEEGKLLVEIIERKTKDNIFQMVENSVHKWLDHGGLQDAINRAVSHKLSLEVNAIASQIISKLKE